MDKHVNTEGKSRGTEKEIQFQNSVR